MKQGSLKSIAVIAYVAMTFFVFSFAVLYSHYSQAQNINDDPRYGEVWKKSQALRDQNSMDTTLVSFSILGVNYLVPRNYLVEMNDWNGGPQTHVTFKATYPGFKPLTEETRQCLTQPRAYWPQGCIPIEFWIHGKDNITDEDHFNNMRSRFVSQTPEKGPDGFEKYTNGGYGDTLFEVYRKKTSKHMLLIDCGYYEIKGKQMGAVCTNYGSPLKNGAGLSYRIDLNQLENAEKIDDGIRDLIDSFNSQGG